MGTSPTRPFCAACGQAQASHTALWILNSSDVCALWLTGHPLPFANFFSKIGSVAADLLGRMFVALGRLIGAITLSDDLETSASRRTRLMWLEARRRGIEMRQLLFWGSPTDTFRVRVDGRIHFFKSLPLPPLHAETLRMDDKIWFKEALAREGLPVPKSSGASNLESAKRALAEFGTVCVKPRSGSNGRHTYPFVKTEEDLSAAFKSVKQICAFASVEEQLEGNLCRATCVGGKLYGFLESSYPTVVGDGVSTIRELVARANAEKPDGVADIMLDDSHTGYIRRRGYELDSVLPSGVSLPLTYRAGASSGGRNRERGRAVHPSFIPIIERAAALTGLSIVGFDLIIPDSEAPAESQRWGFIEANSLPWIDLHAAPFSGEPNDLSAAVWDLWLVS